MVSKKAIEPHLSVRKKREIDQMKRKIAEYQAIGNSNPKTLIRKYADAVGKQGTMAFKDVPDYFKRQVLVLMKVLFVPKSPRGRKPLKQHAA
jgi:hypothetical protein